MLLILISLELVGVGILVGELWVGVAVTGWQGEKPFVEKTTQPFHYWSIILVHLIFVIVLPGLLILFR